MQTGIHPKYDVATVKCACGNEFVTRSTMSLIKVDICSACHPFFTGQQKLIDAAGRVEKFSKRFAKSDGKTVVRAKQVQQKISKLVKVPGKIVLSTELSAAEKKEKNKKKPAH